MFTFQKKSGLIDTVDDSITWDVVRCLSKARKGRIEVRHVDDVTSCTIGLNDTRPDGKSISAHPPFEMLGLPEVGTEPVTVDAERAMGAVPPVLLGVAAAMSGIYWLAKRRDRMGREMAGEKDKEEVKR